MSVINIGISGDNIVLKSVMCHSGAVKLLPTSLTSASTTDGVTSYHLTSYHEILNCTLIAHPFMLDYHSCTVCGFPLIMNDEE